MYTGFYGDEKKLFTLKKEHYSSSAPFLRCVIFNSLPVYLLLKPQGGPTAKTGAPVASHKAFSLRRTSSNME